MTRTLRQRHRFFFVVLAIAVPALFVAALAVRRAVPQQPLPSTIISINSHTR